MGVGWRWEQFNCPIAQVGCGPLGQGTGVFALCVQGAGFCLIQAGAGRKASSSTALVGTSRVCSSQGRAGRLGASQRVPRWVP